MIVRHYTPCDIVVGMLVREGHACCDGNGIVDDDVWSINIHQNEKVQ